MSDASDVRRKRNGSAEAPSKKRLKKDQEDKENDEDEEIDSKCTPQEIVGNVIQISKTLDFSERSGRLRNFWRRPMKTRQKRQTIP